MNKTLIFSSCLLLACASASFGQTAPTPPAKQKDQNIIIHKKGAGKEKTTIVIDGNKVTINGKPADEYKNGDVDVITNNPFTYILPPMPPLPPHGGSKMFESFRNMLNSAFLGVASESEDGGATISSVTKGSAAEKAGLKEGDIITKVGNDNVDDANDLTEAIGNHKPQEKVNITYKRGGKENVTTATLDKNKQPSFNWNDNNAANNLMKNFSFRLHDNKPRLGLRVQDVETGAGVKVIDINDDESPAAKAGLKEDDVITEMNGKKVSSVKDVKDELTDIKPGDDVKISYQRGGATQSATVHFPKDLQTSDL